MAKKKKEELKEEVAPVEEVIEAPAEEKAAEVAPVESLNIADVSLVSAQIKNGVAIVKGKTSDGKSFSHEMVMKNRYGAQFTLK